MKKKILVLLTVLSLTLGVTACGGDSNSNNTQQQSSETVQTTETPKQNDLEVAKQTYKLLNDSAVTCSYMASSIAVAWGFTIRQSNEYAINTKNIAKELGIEEEKFAEAAKELNLLIDKEFLSDFSSVVAAVIQYFKNEGLYSKLDKALATIKENIKSLPTDASYYQGLKDYYSELVNYSDFCKSPSGSYKDLSGTISGYDNNLKKYKSDLSFDLE